MTGTAPAAAPAPVVAVLKDEPLTRVEVIALPGGHAVRKTYRSHPLLRWRTFATPSRGCREFLGLSAAFGRGVPCVEPLSWDEVRRLGCALASVVVTRYLPAAPSLKTELAGGAVPAAARGALATALGDLLRRLHQAGVLSCRRTPRNVLVRGRAPWDLVLCDLPAAVAFAASIHGQPVARIDLYDALFSWSRRLELSRAQRWRALCAYHAGDRVAARRSWQRLVRRPRWWNQLRKAALVSWDSYLRQWLLALRRGGLPRPVR